MWIRAAACRVEVLISIRKPHFALSLSSTKINKLNFIGEVFEEVSLRVLCCYSVFLMCVVQKKKQFCCARKEFFYVVPNMNLENSVLCLVKLSVKEIVSLIQKQHQETG